MQFLDVPSPFRKLDEFLSGHLFKTQAKREFFELDEVTGEMEEPAGVSVISRQRTSQGGNSCRGGGGGSNHQGVAEG